MVRKAHIQDGVVVNISIASELQPGDIDGDGAHIGDLWDGSTFSRAPKWASVELGQEDLCAAINTLRDEKEAEGFTYNGTRFQSDPRSADRIANAALAATSALATSTAFSVSWSAEDNTVIALDAMGMLAMQGALTQHAAALHYYARSLKDQVRAQTTVAQLEAIDINAGWPE